MSAITAPFSALWRSRAVPAGRSAPPFDWPLFTMLLALVSIGLVFGASAAGHSLQMQLVRWVALGAVVGWVAWRLSLRTWMALSGWALLAAFVGLILVLVPGLGVRVNGSQRWLDLGLPVALQVSEFAKPALLLSLAAYLVRRGARLRHWSGLVAPLGVLGLLLFLLLRQPDFGAAAVIVFTVFGLLFLAGMPLLRFCACAGLGGLGLAWLATAAGYRLERILAFMDPWADQFDSGYQLTQALIAFGRGEWLGVGLGNSLQKLFYLPEAHTDFVFAVLAEETGLLGAGLLVGLVWAISYRIGCIGWRCLAVAGGKRELQFGGYLALGVGGMFLVQCFINMGVACGLLPTKGLTLPFVSYGGSSMLAWCLMMGLVLRVSKELQAAAGGRAGRR